VGFLWSPCIRPDIICAECAYGVFSHQTAPCLGPTIGDFEPHLRTQEHQKDKKRAEQRRKSKEKRDAVEGAKMKEEEKAKRLEKRRIAWETRDELAAKKDQATEN